MDLVSVIIPVYNIDKWLGDCLRSVCGQTYEQLQIIIINDGSTDHSARICEQFARQDHRIQLICQDNRGLAEARNKAMECVLGKYVVFVDGDDWVDITIVQKLYDACEQYRTQMAICSYRDVLPDGHIAKYRHIDNRSIRKVDSHDILKRMLCQNKREPIKSSVWAKMYRWELIKSYLFPAGKHYEDNLFTARAVYESGTCVYLDEALYYYRKGREGSILWKDELHRLITDEIEMEEERLSYFKQHQETKLAGYATKQMLFHMLAYYGRMLQKPEKYGKWMREFSEVLQHAEFPYQFDLVTAAIIFFRIAPILAGKLLKNSYQIIQKKRMAEFARKGYCSVQIGED